MNIDTERLWTRLQRYLAEGQTVPARITLESILLRNPRTTEAHLALSDMAWQENRVRAASRHALDAANVVADDPGLICNVITALLRTGEMVPARVCLERTVPIRGISCELLMQLANFRYILREHSESLALLDRALAMGCNGAPLHFQRARELVSVGRFDEAEVGFQRCLDFTLANGRAALGLSRLRKQTAESNHIAEWKIGLQKVARGTRDHAALEFALYKELEDLKRYEEAWDALVRGNAVMCARNPEDAAQRTRFIGRFIERCTLDIFKRTAAPQAGPQPIFILGLPRSGTTLLDRLLGAHSQIVSAGELSDFGQALYWTADIRETQDELFLQRMTSIDNAEAGQRYLSQTQWRSNGKSFFIDKQPPNWALAGFIRAALPKAHILHMVREPMDVCFSNWRAFFGDAHAFSYDLTALASHYHDYRRVMAHWHALMPGAILDVSYAQLVQEPEKTMRDVLAHCGLEWEANCVDTRRNPAPVATISAAQVRDSIHTKAFGEWKPYRDRLEPLQRALSETR